MPPSKKCSEGFLLVNKEQFFVCMCVGKNCFLNDHSRRLLSFFWLLGNADFYSTYVFTKHYEKHRIFGSEWKIKLGGMPSSSRPQCGNYRILLLLEKIREIIIPSHLVPQCEKLLQIMITLKNFREITL